MKVWFALLLAAPAAAQFRTAPIKAPVLSPGLMAPALIAPSLSAPGPTAALARPMTLTPTLPSALAIPAAPAVRAQPAAAAAAVFAAPASAASAVKEAAPEGSAEAAKSKPAEAAARLGTLFDGSGLKAGKLADALEAPAAKDAVDLSRVPTDATPHVKSEKKAASRMKDDLKQIVKYQEMLFARGERAVVLVFQGMDTGGKDGVIKTVVGAMNPQGVKVTSFKKPTKEEAAQHYLKRIKDALPVPGGVGVFNRSHYEDIVVPTVLGTHKPEEIELRYDEINEFEKALAEKGVLVLKFFMHISKAEQKRRLQDRLDNPDKNWKFSPADLEMRKKWDGFQKAWGKVMARTNTPWAPWYVIPADNKWYRDYAVGRILRKTLDKLGLSYPAGPEHPEKIVIPD
ncbi:hypothetical protein EPO15_09400 [bacterium]|nr:MAG: hypothetical protein EPO15_09400 [bacterium]